MRNYSVLVALAALFTVAAGPLATAQGRVVGAADANIDIPQSASTRSVLAFGETQLGLILTREMTKRRL